MPIYIYTGRSNKGQKVNGELAGPSKENVAKQLQKTGIIPLSISPKPTLKLSKTKANINFSIGSKKATLKPDELIFFSRQMYTLTKSSVPLMKALEGLEKTTNNERIEMIIRNIIESLNEGLDLTNAIKKQSHVFSDLYANLIRIGETTGNLSEIFEELSRFLQKEKDTRDKVKSALTYPITVMSVIAIGLIVVSVFVLPAFAEMFGSFNAELPLPTRILIGFSDFTSQYSVPIIGVLIATVFAVRRYLNTPKGKLWWHEKQYKIPLFGKLLLQNSTSRFARTMSITSRAGVPMEQALQIIGPAIGNLYMEKKIDHMRSSVERGESVTNSLIKADIFPGLVIQMISVGEDAGTLDEMVSEVSEYFDREIEQSVKALTAAIEPITIAMIAGIVLVLALGVFLPMISLMGAIN